MKKREHAAPKVVRWHSTLAPLVLIAVLAVIGAGDGGGTETSGGDEKQYNQLQDIIATAVEEAI